MQQDNADLQALFGLSGDEELMESFQCTLAQTYKCLHNTFSEPREVRTCSLPCAPSWASIRSQFVRRTRPCWTTRLSNLQAD